MGMTTLEQNIARLEAATTEAREATREAHAATKDLDRTRREVDALLTTRAKELVEERVADLVKAELDRIGPMLSEQSTAIYERVGKQVDLLIDLCLGKRFARQHNREDIRPALAAKLRKWLQEEVDRV